MAQKIALNNLIPLKMYNVPAKQIRRDIKYEAERGARMLCGRFIFTYVYNNKKNVCILNCIPIGIHKIMIRYTIWNHRNIIPESEKNMEGNMLYVGTSNSYKDLGRMKNVHSKRLTYFRSNKKFFGGRKTEFRFTKYTKHYLIITLF